MRSDPFAEIKRQVLDRLDSRPTGTRLEVEHKVRMALQEVLMTGGHPLTSADRARVANDVCDVLGARAAMRERAPSTR